MLLCTHGHGDHIGDAVAICRELQPTVVGIYELASWLGGKGAKNISPMNKGGTQEVAGVKITMVHAVHSCGIQEEDGSFVYGGEACGYVLEFSNGLKLYHAGDTAVFSDMQIIHDLYRPDIALLPMGDHFTMGIREAEYACKLLKPRIVVPMHFGTFPMLTGDPHDLRPAAGAARVRAMGYAARGCPRDQPQIAGYGWPLWSAFIWPQSGRGPRFRPGRASPPAQVSIVRIRRPARAAALSEF